MPEIKLIEVKGYSLQDERHPSENLLSGKVSGGRWLSPVVRNISSMSVTFQLAECCVINSIHIGNSGSAFVSVLVSRTGIDAYRELLPCSSLMTLQESRTGQNKSCVKMFIKDDLLEETRDEKWDQLRVVVTQPFNHKLQFGLCFVRVFSFMEDDSAITETNSDFLTKLESMRSQISNSSPSTSKLTNRRLSGSFLYKNDKVKFLQSSHQSDTKHEKEKSIDTRNEDDEENDAIFEASIISFMDCLKLQDKDLDNIQCVDVREKMEQIQERKFSLRERRIFISVLKKYVKSLQNRKARDTLTSPNGTRDYCSREDPVKLKQIDPMTNTQHHSHNNKKEQISENDSGRRNRSSETGWLTTQRDYSMEASTSKEDSCNTRSPSVRRNKISLEDSGHILEGKHRDIDIGNKLKGGDGCFRSEDSVEKSECVVDSKNTMKRKLSIENHSNKKFCVMESNADATEVPEFLEVISDSEQSTGDRLVECPICTGYFESDAIVKHSSECVEFSQRDGDELLQNVVCPMCSRHMTAAVADIHADFCAKQLFGD